MEPARPTVDFATPEDVPLSFELAGVGTRILAALLDQLIIITVQVGIGMFLLAVGMVAEFVTEQQVQTLAEEMQQGGPTLVLLGVSLLLGFVVNFGYYVLMEMSTNGQTVGKRVMGIRVIRDGGYPITLTASLLRNLGRLVDMLPNTYVVGMIAMIVHRQEKRMGDMLAGTVVVREQTRDASGLPFGDERYSTLTERRYHLDRATITDLAEEHERILEHFFTRPRLQQAQEHRVVVELADGFAGRLSEPPAFETHRDRLLFLKELYLALRERRELG